MSVITAGRQMTGELGERPDELPAAVLGGLRSSKQTKADLTMANLRDEEQPAPRAEERRATPALAR
jgi:hypothetical protein